jgi:hypothetical protein
MHFCTFVMIGQHDHPETAVARALEPFNESLELEPHRDHLGASEIEHMASHYGIPATDLPALARKMEDWRSSKGGVDTRGLYAISTYNPDGKWDWYEIGGRWDRYIPGSHRNVISARALRRSSRLRKCLPYVLLTPEGRWIEQVPALPFGSPKTKAHRRAVRRWFTRVRRVLVEHPKCNVVCVDIHS